MRTRGRGSALEFSQLSAETLRLFRSGLGAPAGARGRPGCSLGGLVCLLGLPFQLSGFVGRALGTLIGVALAFAESLEFALQLAVMAAW